MDRLTVPASMQQMGHVVDFVENSLVKYGCGQEPLRKLLMTVDEIFSNIVRYAYGEAGGEAEIAVEVRDQTALMRFTDGGVPYNPLDMEDPDVTLSSEDRQVGGLGIYMVKQSMDSVDYEYRDGKNILTVRKSI